MTLLRPSIPTRDLILQHAVELIDKRGEAAVKVHEIAAEVCSSTSSIYHYFGSREGLIEAAQTERFARGSLAMDVTIAPAFLAAQTKEEFREAVIMLHEVSFDPMVMPRRLMRVNTVGSVLGRPQLAREMGEIQNQLQTLFASTLRPAQERGWIRSDVDVRTLASWTMGQLFGRVLIELGESTTSSEEWNRLALEAALFHYFGETPSSEKIYEGVILN